MIKNYINHFANINPVYLIDFSIGEEYVINELKKTDEKEIVYNLKYLLKTALYFRYFKLYDMLKNKAYDFMLKNAKNDFIASIIERTEELKKYV
jgi:hypothetical protein